MINHSNFKRMLGNRSVYKELPTSECFSLLKNNAHVKKIVTLSKM